MFPPWLRAQVGGPHREKWVRKGRKLFLMISSKDP